MSCKLVLSVSTFSIVAAACGGLRDEMPRAEENVDETSPATPVGQEVPAEGVIFEGPPNAREIGVAGDRAYWRFLGAKGSGVVSGSLRDGTTEIVVPAIDEMHAFDVASRVVYQTSGGSVFVLDGTRPVELHASGEPCRALTSDASAVYCLREDTILAWTDPSADPTVIYAGAPPSTAIAVDDRFVYLATESAGTVTRAPKVGTGPFLGEVVTDRRSGVERLSVSAFDLVWAESAPEKTQDEIWWTPIGQTTATKIAGGTRVFVMDRGARVVFLGATDGTATIDRLDLATGARSKVGEAATSEITGAAVDDRFVYWTSRDGRIRRAPK